jgi:hypothetical protein
LRGQKFPDEEGKRAICRKKRVVSGLMLRCHRVFLLRLKLKVNAGALAAMQKYIAFFGL